MEQLTKDEIEALKKKLAEEKKLLTTELSRIGRKNPNNPSDWEAQPDSLDVQESDRNEAADRIESYEENTAILKELEIRFNNVDKALEKIATGSYGTCEVTGEPIARERLFANPAARTCIKHAS